MDLDRTATQRHLVPLLLSMVTLIGATRARAAPPEVAGTIVKVDGGEVFVDIGRADGLAAGDTLEVFRRIEIKHPVTRRVLIDRFPTGTVTVAEAGHLLSIIDTFDDLDPPPQVGDHVVITSRPRGAAPVVATTSTTPCAPAAPCPATLAGPEVTSPRGSTRARSGCLPRSASRSGRGGCAQTRPRRERPASATSSPRCASWRAATTRPPRPRHRASRSPRDRASCRSRRGSRRRRRR